MQMEPEPDSQARLAEAPRRKGTKAALAAFESETGFFFAAGSRQEHLRMFGHLLRYSDLLLVLTGPAGVGKTCLVRMFMESDTRGLRTCRIEGEEFMGADGLCALLGRELNVDLGRGKPAPERVEVLTQLAEEIADSGAIGVVIVDNAHQLAEDALEFLADAAIACRESAGLRFLLAGERQLKDHLEHSRLVDRLQGKCHYIELEPFSRDLAEDYIEQRLASVGLSGDLFTAAEIDYILEFGKGTPGLIHDAAVKVLRSGVPGATPTKDAGVGIPRMHLVAIGVVAAAILGSVLMNSGGDEQGTSKGTLDVPAVRLIDAPKIVPARPEAPETINVREVQGDGKAALPPGQLPVRERVQLGREAPAIVAPETMAPGSPPNNPDPQRAPADGAGKDTEIAAAGPASPEAKAETVGTSATAPKPGVLPGEAVPTDLPDELQESVSPPSPVSESAPAPGSPAPSPEVATASPATPDPEARRREAFLAARAKPAAGVRDESWLLEQTPASYTLQVLGTYSAESARKFVNQQGNREDFVIFRTRLNGRDWHVVVYNMYPNRNAAVAAIQSLPWALRKQKPWARSMESIHKAILEDRAN